MSGDDFRIYLALLALAGLAIAVGANGLFAWRLRHAHPDLWPSYWNLFWAWPSEARSAALRNQVYNRISDRLTRSLLLLQKLGFGLYVLLLVAAGLLFMLTLGHL